MGVWSEMTVSDEAAGDTAAAALTSGAGTLATALDSYGALDVGEPVVESSAGAYLCVS